MKKAIYKIENLINHKLYIGQSYRPNIRWREHVRGNNEPNCPLHRAIKKYGEENFSFEILGWYEDYNGKEKEYIVYYNSKVPNGYNVQNGGQEPPILKGDKNCNTKLSQEQADKVISDLLDWKIPRKTVIKRNNITSDMCRHITEGNAWRKENLSYPLRPSETELDKYRVLYIQWLCCTSTIPLNKIGEKVGWSRSSAKMINQGNNHKDERLKYPIRNNAEYNKQILNQESCIDYLHFGE